MNLTELSNYCSVWLLLSTGNNLVWFIRVFDNIAILSTIKFLNVEPKPFNKAGMTFWFLALVFGLVVAVRDLLVLRHKKGAILRM